MGDQFSEAYKKRSTEQRCPDEDILVSYLGGNLRETQIEQVEWHLARCGVCRALMVAMRAFDEPIEPEPNWPAVEARLQCRLNAAISNEEPVASKRGRPRLHRLLWNPIAAYAIVAMLVYPACLGTFQHRSAMPDFGSARPVSLENTKLVQLDASRSGISASSGVESRDERVLALSFFVPIREGFRYAATIADRSGQTVAGPLDAHSYDGLGHFVVICPLSGFPKGQYSLRINESSQTGVTAHTFEFPFLR